MRMDVHIKVELDLNEKEQADKIASEIIRLVRRAYGVRTAEVSSIVEKD
jgi:hypothetical protein